MNRMDLILSGFLRCHVEFIQMSEGIIYLYINEYAEKIPDYGKYWLNNLSAV